MLQNSPKWIVEVDGGLRDELLASINEGPMYPGGVRSLNEATIARIGNLKIQIFSDEHPPPHFRVACAGETADFTIRDCTQLTGNLAKWRHNIVAWHAKNKDALIAKWDALRPTDCPVGKYEES